MIHLFKDPKGQTILNTSSTGDTKKDSITGVATNIDEVSGLKQQILELEKKLAEVIIL